MFISQEQEHLKDNANGEIVKEFLRDQRRSQTLVDGLERGIYFRYTIGIGDTLTHILISIQSRRRRRI